jgi:hypothetical protein
LPETLLRRGNSRGWNMMKLSKVCWNMLKNLWYWDPLRYIQVCWGVLRYMEMYWDYMTHWS